MNGTGYSQSLLFVLEHQWQTGQSLEGKRSKKNLARIPTSFMTCCQCKRWKKGKMLFPHLIVKMLTSAPSLIPTKWDHLFFLCLSLIYKGNCTFLPWRMHVKKEQWYACPYSSSESTQESIKGGRAGRCREVKNEHKGGFGSCHNHHMEASTRWDRGEEDKCE